MHQDAVAGLVGHRLVDAAVGGDNVRLTEVGERRFSEEYRGGRRAAVRRWWQRQRSRSQARSRSERIWVSNSDGCPGACEPVPRSRAPTISPPVPSPSTETRCSIARPGATMRLIWVVCDALRLFLSSLESLISGPLPGLKVILATRPRSVPSGRPASARSAARMGLAAPPAAARRSAPVHAATAARASAVAA